MVGKVTPGSSLTTFDLINGLMHRRPVYDVNGTAFIRHVAFWPKPEHHPLSINDHRESGLRALRWIAHINSILITLLNLDDPIEAEIDRNALPPFRVAESKFSAGHKDHPDQHTSSELNPGRISALGNDPNDLINTYSADTDANWAEFLFTPGDNKHISDTWLSRPYIHDGWRLRVRADLHVEYFTLTFILDEPDKRGDPSTCHTKIQTLISHIHGSVEPFRTLTANSKKNSNYPFKELWDEVDAALWPKHEHINWPPVNYSKSEENTPETTHNGVRGLIEKLGLAERFADFRGFLPVVAPDAPETSNSTAYTEEARNSEPCIWDMAPIYVSDERDHFYKDSLKRQTEFISRENVATFYEEALAIHSGTELVLTGLLDGLGTYASTLGRDGAKSEKDSGPEWVELQPLRYIVTYGGRNNYQRGRMMRLLHDAGVLRLVALRDLYEVRYAAQAMRRIGQELREIKLSDAKYEKVDELYASYLSSTRGAAGDIEYRTARSTHYVEHWKRIGQQLRQVRLEGWQTYTEFVLRRVGSQFDYIASAQRRSQILAEQFETAFAAKQAAAGLEMSSAQVRLAHLAAWVGLPAGVASVYQVLQALTSAALAAPSEMAVKIGLATFASGAIYFGAFLGTLLKRGKDRQSWIKPQLVGTIRFGAFAVAGYLLVFHA
jgi:hypothetical protein